MFLIRPVRWHLWEDCTHFENMICDGCIHGDSKCAPSHLLAAALAISAATPAASITPIGQAPLQVQADTDMIYTWGRLYTSLAAAVPFS